MRRSAPLSLPASRHRLVLLDVDKQPSMYHYRASSFSEIVVTQSLRFTAKVFRALAKVPSDGGQTYIHNGVLLRAGLNANSSDMSHTIPEPITVMAWLRSLGLPPALIAPLSVLVVLAAVHFTRFRLSRHRK